MCLATDRKKHLVPKVLGTLHHTIKYPKPVLTISHHHHHVPHPSLAVCHHHAHDPLLEPLKNIRRVTIQEESAIIDDAATAVEKLKLQTQEPLRSSVDEQQQAVLPHVVSLPPPPTPEPVESECLNADLSLEMIPTGGIIIMPRHYFRDEHVRNQSPQADNMGSIEGSKVFRNENDILNSPEDGYATPLPISPLRYKLQTCPPPPRYVRPLLEIEQSIMPEHIYLPFLL